MKVTITWRELAIRRLDTDLAKRRGYTEKEHMEKRLGDEEELTEDEAMSIGILRDW